MQRMASETLQELARRESAGNAAVTDKFTKLRHLREAGMVQRCHLIPHVGEYSNAHHSWNVAVLIDILHPHPPRELLQAALYHDVGERICGDIPATAKWMEGHLRIGSNVIEEQFRKQYGVQQTLTEKDFNWLKAVDMLELWLWCQDQRAMGNLNVLGVLNNIDKWLQRRKANIPGEVLEVFALYHWARESDYLDVPVQS